MSRLVARGFERLSGVEGRYLAMAFFGLLLVYTLALIVEALGYSEAARLFPLIVGIPLAVMLVVNILLLAVEDRIDLQVVGFFDAVGEIDTIAAEARIPEAIRYRREAAMVAWIGLLVVLTWLVGNLVAIFLFLFAFVYVHERQPVRALVVAAVTFGFIYLLFVRILGATLWRGVIPLGGVLP